MTEQLSAKPFSKFSLASVDIGNRAIKNCIREEVETD